MVFVKFNLIRASEVENIKMKTHKEEVPSIKKVMKRPLLGKRGVIISTEKGYLRVMEDGS